MEKFAWASKVSLTPPCLVATEENYLVADRALDQVALGTPNDVLTGEIEGYLLAASTILEVLDGTEQRWLMVERDEHASTNPFLWHFPSGLLAPKELPLNAAVRTLIANVKLTDRGLFHPFNEAAYRVGGEEFEWLMPDAVHTGVRARQVYHDRTVEFWYHAVLHVREMGDVEAFDKTTAKRDMALFTAQQIDEMVQQGHVCPISALQWKAHKEHRATMA